MISTFLRRAAAVAALATVFAGFDAGTALRSGGPGEAPPPSYLAVRPYAACRTVRSAADCDLERRAVLEACRARGIAEGCGDAIQLMEALPHRREYVLSFREPGPDPRPAWFRDDEADPVRASVATVAALLLAAALFVLRRPPAAALVAGAVRGVGSAMLVAAACGVAVFAVAFAGGDGSWLVTVGALAAPGAAAVAAALTVGSARGSEVPVHLGLASGAVGLFGWQVLVGPGPTPASFALEIAFALALAIAGALLAPAPRERAAPTGGPALG